VTIVIPPYDDGTGKLDFSFPSMLGTLYRDRAALIAAVSAAILLILVGWWNVSALIALPEPSRSAPPPHADVVDPVTAHDADQRFAFVPFRPGSDPASDDAARQAAPSRLELTVEGILYLPARNGGAILVRHRDEWSTVTVGEEILPNVELRAIRSDHVVIDNRGRQETVALEKPRTTLATDASGRSPRSRIAHRHARVEQEAAFLDHDD